MENVSEIKKEENELERFRKFLSDIKEINNNTYEEMKESVEYVLKVISILEQSGIQNICHGFNKIRFFLNENKLTIRIENNEEELLSEKLTNLLKGDSFFALSDIIVYLFRFINLIISQNLSLTNNNKRFSNVVKETINDFKLKEYENGN